jgi:hypothetical protein
MDALREKKGAEALRAYVAGDSSEPIVISAVRDLTGIERSTLVTRHRLELAAIDASRLVILESLVLPFDQRRV